MTLNLPVPDPTASKPWTASRTVIFNVALTLVFALGLVGQLAGAFSIDPKWVALAGAGAAVINFYLRLDTSAPIAGTALAAKADVAKQTIALNAAHDVLTTQPVAASQPTLDDLPALLRELKARHDADGALLAQLAGAATGGAAVPTP